MVTENAALYARFRKRAAEIGGAPPEPRKKARSSSGAGAGASVAQSGASRSAREVPSIDRRGSGSAEASAMLACPAPLSQRPDRRPVEQRRSDSEQRRSDTEPGSSQGAPRSPPPPPSPARLSLSGPPKVDPRPERRPYLPSWEVFEGDSALDDPAVARQVFRVALLPADQAKIRSTSYNSFLDGTYYFAIRVSLPF